MIIDKLLAASLVLAAPAHAQLTVQVTSAPPGTPAGAAIYIAGTFNQWNPAAGGYRLAQQAGGGYAITLPVSVRGTIEFKFTLGSWQRVETGSSGDDVANRTFTVPDAGVATYTTTIAGWKDAKPAPPREPTATASVSILSAAFDMPELGRSRRVWIYLPPGYTTTNRSYPVLYMHDGQNVFDAATSYVGEWGVDETLDSLVAGGDAGVIVVAIDHGAAKRFDEYSPWKNQRYGGGEGDAYVDFIVNTLKPYIDRHYRTLADAANTAIAGSSMGGLISLYAALKYPRVFGEAGVFSPALWVAPEVADYARERAVQFTAMTTRPRLYFVSAASEAQLEAQIAVSQPLMRALESAGYAVGQDLMVRIEADGAHSEWFWRREFAAAYRWLFGR